MIILLHTFNNNKIHVNITTNKLLWVPSHYTSKIPPDLGKIIAENISKNAPKVTPFLHIPQSPKVISTSSPNKTLSTSLISTPPSTPPAKVKSPIDLVGTIKPVLNSKIPIMNNEEYIKQPGFVKEQHIKNFHDSLNNKSYQYEEPDNISNTIYTKKGVITSTSSSNIKDKTKVDISLNVPVAPANPLKILTQPVDNSKNICYMEELKNKTKPTNVDGQNNKPSIIQLLTQTEKMDLSKYDDAHEKGYYDVKNAAEGKLTHLGRSVFKGIKNPNNKQESQPLINLSSNTKYEAGILQVSDETLILLAEYTHLVVVLNNKTNIYIGLSILTNQNNAETTKCTIVSYQRC